MVQIDFEVELGFAGKVHVEMAENTILVGVEGTLSILCQVLDRI